VALVTLLLLVLLKVMMVAMAEDFLVVVEAAEPLQQALMDHPL
tara:strand:- start:263 stop:391 length:129 start_codon:yes stop_codon:yes gene_type:complete